jgi:hypothetical protein
MSALAQLRPKWCVAANDGMYHLRLSLRRKKQRALAAAQKSDAVENM